ncbi:hypothetical protein GF319_07795 [Candidatus Bathyarchaeota archaeon]|nr:hypothetical protein [Candidatus Bathyarchaeota archaeon]
MALDHGATGSHSGYIKDSSHPPSLTVIGYEEGRFYLLAKFYGFFLASAQPWV